MKKRVLFVGPTGSGKSTLINVLFNDDVKKESMTKPAVCNDTSSGVTSYFTTYYNLPSYAYTDSIGFGDNRFTHQEIFSCLRCILKQSMVGYNRVYLCLRYGRISNEPRTYLELLTTIFDDGILAYCTIIFTHCKDELMTKELYLEKNRQDTDICALINRVRNVIFGDNNTDDNEVIDSILSERRKVLLNHFKNDIDKSSDHYYIPRPTDFSEWITRIFTVLQRVILSLNPRGGLATLLTLTHADINALSRVINEQNVTKYREYYGECSICLESMWMHDKTITKCHHVFHRQCLQQLPTLVCPLCNGTIDLPE